MSPNPIPATTAYVALAANRALGAGAWTWTSVTADGSKDALVRAADKITVTQGRTDAFSLVPPSTAAARVDNGDGRWTPQNENGLWAGRIRRGTPFKILLGDGQYSVPVFDDNFNRTVSPGLGTPSSGGTGYNLGGSGGTVLSSDYACNGSQAQVSVPVASGFRYFRLASVSEVDVDGYCEFTAPAATGGNIEAGLMLRGGVFTEYYHARVHMTTGGTLQAQLDHAGGSTLAGPVAVTGVTYSAGTTVKLLARCFGTYVEMFVWTSGPQPTNPTLFADDGFPIAAAGFVGVRTGRAAGNTNAGVTVSYDLVTFTARPVRMDGFIDELPMDWDPTGRDSTVLLGLSGSLRRLKSGDPPLQSAMYRAMTSHAAPQPVGYWPMEDSSGALSLAAVTPSTQPAGFTSLNLGAYSACRGSKPLPTLNADTYVYGSVPRFSSFSGLWSVVLVVGLSAFTSPQTFPLGWYCEGTIATWGVVVTSTGIKVEARNSAGTELLGSATLTSPTMAGSAIMVRVSATQVGGDVDWTLDALWGGLSSGTGGTATTQTLGQPTGWQIAHSAGLAGSSVGHVGFYDHTQTEVSGAVNGWAGTSAQFQISQLCADANVPIQMVTPPSNVPGTQMGAQANSSLIGLLRDCEKADQGILSEGGFGLRYLHRYQRYNRPVALTLDFTAKKIAAMRPTTDDRYTLNDFTASRASGSSARDSDEAHVVLYDRNANGETFALDLDSDLPHYASWFVWRGTNEDLRVPQISVNLRSRPELIPAILALRVGDRIQITRSPSQTGGLTIDLILEGWTETFDSGEGSWIWTANCSPAGPLDVFVLDSTSGNLGRIDEASTLAGGIAAGTTAVTLRLPTGSQGWNPAALPLVMAIGNSVGIEQVTMTAAAAPAAGTQNVTITRGTGGTVGKAHDFGEAFHLWRAAPLAL